MTRNAPLFAAAALALLLGGGPARAGVVFSNFGPGDNYNISAGDIVLGPGVEAAKFTAAGGGTLTTIDLALTSQFGIQSPVTVELHADSGGTVGTLLSTGSTTTTGFFGFYHPPAVAPMSSASLTAGTMYWVLVSAPNPPDIVVWNRNSTGDVGPLARSVDGGLTFTYTNETHGAFRVNTADATAVPEPGTLALLAAGGACLALGRLRRRPKKLLPLCAALVLVLGAAGPADAGVIYSNFGPGDSFAPEGELVGGTSSSYDNRGTRFTVGATDYTFTSAEVPLQLIGGANSVTFGLRADAGGLPGALLQTFTATNIPTTFPGGIVTFQATAPLLLSAGTSYWLTSELYPPLNTSASWRIRITADLVPNALRENMDPWQLDNNHVAFRINGDPVATAVPEPASLTLLGAGGLGLLVYARRRRASRADGASPGG